MSGFDSGLGAFGFGESPFGHDPEDDTLATTGKTIATAPFFDPLSRAYSLNDDLSLVSADSPIHRAAHLILKLGTLPSIPLSGLNTEAIRRATRERRLRVIEDELRVALKVLLDTQQIVIRAVTLEDGEPWSGAFYVEIEDLVSSRARADAGTVTLTGRV